MLSPNRAVVRGDSRGAERKNHAFKNWLPDQRMKFNYSTITQKFTQKTANIAGAGRFGSAKVNQEHYGDLSRVF
ncbi:hypothetical protein HMPREF9061_00510 [Actinomyces sp. oral taxon 181 str. F0379]|nr:hypothetical protein HMPREF9061_00510 [Actinomyces sp. oral taxon 181 str. F0379]